MTELATLLSDLVAINSVNPDLAQGGAGEGDIADYIANCGAAHVHVTGAPAPNVPMRAASRIGCSTRYDPSLYAWNALQR